MAAKKKPTKAQIGGDQIQVGDVERSEAVAAGRKAKVIKAGQYIEKQIVQPSARLRAE